MDKSVQLVVVSVKLTKLLQLNKYFKTRPDMKTGQISCIIFVEDTQICGTTSINYYLLNLL